MRPVLPLPVLMLGLIACNQPDETAVPPAGEAAVIASVDIWDVPFEESRSRDPYASPDGRIFFAGQRAHYVGFFDPETEEFGYHELEDGTGPHTVAVGEDGTVWYAGNRARHIGIMDP
ncbi:MAG: hypothetical protein WDZ53_02630, partial [Balneolales bacterium]